ncbi:amidase [Nesterenkonia muleiensis]|uniref:amidase n=1 Tax=Nesterenkonia muleiensis TaxID=2282648 RepID=UPI000E70EBDD|nr:amidase [Nesterenkonia muleiensis]
MKHYDVVEMSIAEMLAALDSGEVTSTDLVCAYLNRIGYYDRTGWCLNAVPIINPGCLAEAEESDARRRRGEPVRPLEGVPFTVKDSYMVEGLTVASGSVALKDLIAGHDAATVQLLRNAGAVLIGKTNMPPMAAGGIQPGVYDYARSPYRPDYLTAAYGSGSSSGSGTGTTASFSAFGMGEETVSSGRSPASNNSLVAYTPSRGLISIRGNWPLRPSCDVVVPHTRTVEDLLHLLDVLVVEDPETEGDFWRQQNAVTLPAPASVRPETFLRERPRRLEGVRLGVPKMYVGEDPHAAVPPVCRETVAMLWAAAERQFEALGAEILHVDFPVVSHYEEDRPEAESLVERGMMPANWRTLESGAVAAFVLDQFLRLNGDPNLSSWADIDGDAVFPAEDAPVHVWVERARGGFDWQRMAEYVKVGLPESLDEFDGLDRLLTGLEEARTRDFEDWMADQGLDAVIFPAAGDVGRDDLFSRPESMAEATRNGVVYSNGNRVIRHLGIPTVTVPMGTMADLQMPVGLTIAGAAYADDRLLDYAWAYEQAAAARVAPYLTPTLPSNRIPAEVTGRAEAAAESSGSAGFTLSCEVSAEVSETHWIITATVETSVAEAEVQAWADGHILLPVKGRSGAFSGKVSTSRKRLDDQIMVLVKAVVGGRSAAVLRFIPLPQPRQSRSAPSPRAA